MSVNSRVATVGKQKARQVTQVLSRRANLDMVESGSPRLLKIARQASALALTSNREMGGAVYGKTNSVTEFLMHWVNNGWTISDLPGLHARLRRTSIIFLFCAGAAGASTLGQLYKVYAAGGSVLTVGTGLCTTIIFIILAAHYGMHCWRIRQWRINGAGYLDSLRADWAVIFPKELPDSYLESLKKAYAQEYRGKKNSGNSSR